MSDKTIPLTQPAQADPLAQLQSIYALHQPVPYTTGTISTGPALPQPSLRPAQPVPQGAGVAQGSFASRAAHTRASLQQLGTTLQSFVAQASNALAQHENKIISQKTDAYTHAIQGISQAQEMLKSDPNNAEAQQMLQRNQDFLKGFLDPTTPDGKKNIKILEKAYPATQNPEEDSEEQKAAQGSLKKVIAQQQMAAASERLQSGQGFPVTAGMSPLTQINAQMVKAGVTPKAATGGQIINAQTQASKAEQTAATAADEHTIQRERLGLDQNDKPIPLDQLPAQQQAKVAVERSKDQLQQAQTVYTQARQAALSNPNSVPNQLSLMRAQAQLKFANAAALRGQAMMLNYYMNAYGTGAQGETLPGTISINGQTVGMRAANAAIKAIQTQAQFIDADGAVDNLDSAIKTMFSAKQSLNDPRLVKLMTDPHFRENDNQEAFDKWISSDVAATLSPEQRQYIIAQKQARENIMAIRRVIGTGVSVAAMDAITQTLPSAVTPDYDYAQRQIQAVKGQLGRLQQGVPQVNIPGRTNQPGAAPSQPPAGGLTYNPQTGTVQ